MSLAFHCFKFYHLSFYSFSCLMECICTEKHLLLNLFTGLLSPHSSAA